MTFACVEEIPVPVAPPSLPGQRELFDDEQLDEDRYDLDVRSCNRCPETYSRLLGKCPRCGSPEFSLVLKESNAMPPATTAKRTTKAKTKPDKKAEKIKAAHPGSKVTKSKLSKLMKENAGSSPAALSSRTAGGDTPKRGPGRPPKTYKDTFSPSEFMKNAATGKINGHTTPADVPKFEMLDPNLIDHNPRNARTEKEIAADPAFPEFCESVKAEGVIEPLIVRPHPTKKGCYIAAAGCRRLLAAKRTELPEVPCVIRTIEESRAVGIRLAENLHRADLTPIQEARDFQDAMQQLDLTQEKLAAIAKKSQAYISQRLSLLKLPMGLQQMVVSELLSLTQARDLAPLSDLPAVMKAAEHQLTKRLDYEGDKPSGKPLGEDHFCWGMADVLEQHMRPMQSGLSPHHFPKFNPDAIELKQLDVRTFSLDGTTKEAWAANVKLWDKLQKLAEAEIAEQQTKPKPRDEGQATPKTQETAAGNAADQADTQPKDEGQRTKDKPVETVSPEELALRAERAAAVYQKRLYRYKVEWLQHQIGLRLKHTTPEQHLVLMIGFALSPFDHFRRDHFCEAVKEVTGKKFDRSAKWADLVALDRGKLSAIMQAFLSRWCQREAKTGNDADPDLINSVAAELGIDFAKQWTIDKDFLEIHTTDQIADLVKEWKLPTSGIEGKGPLIDHLTTKAPKPAFTLPKCLKTLKPVTLD